MVHGSRGFEGFLTSSHSSSHSSKSMALADLFGHLSHSVVRTNARAILTQSYSHLVQQLCVVICIVCSCVCICVQSLVS